CRVDVVSDTHATCLGDGRPGDTFPLEPRAEAAEEERARTGAGPLPDAEVARRRRALENGTFERVDFRGAPRPPLLSGRTDGQLGYFIWTATGAGDWQQERLDAAVRGAPVGGGFALYADLSARWSARTGPALTGADEASQLYVWEAELVRRPASGLSV